jgi:hypothetical protein
VSILTSSNLLALSNRCILIVIKLEKTAKLKNYFTQFGKVMDAAVMMDPITQRSRGFGFIVFENPDSIDAVLKQGPHRIDNKIVRLFFLHKLYI